jgi:hypothetical protein
MDGRENWLACKTRSLPNFRREQKGDPKKFSVVGGYFVTDANIERRAHCIDVGRFSGAHGTGCAARSNVTVIRGRKPLRFALEMFWF